MILTGKLLDAGKSANGGWNSSQLRVFGFNGHEHKWRKRCIGMHITQEQYEEFLYMRNKHLEHFDAKPVSFCATDAWAMETRQALLSKKNSAERHVDQLLRQSLFKYNREQPIEVDGKKYFIDFYIRKLSAGKNRPRVCVALEIDGGYHFTPEQRRKDAAKDKDLLCSVLVSGVVRISAERAMSMDLLSLCGAIVNGKPYGTKLYY